MCFVNHGIFGEGADILCRIFRKDKEFCSAAARISAKLFASRKSNPIKQKSPVPKRTRPCSRVTTFFHRQLTLPISVSTFACPAGGEWFLRRVRQLKYPGAVTCAGSVAAYWGNWISHFKSAAWIPLGAKLRDVFAICFPRASHPPAAFCVSLQVGTCSLRCLLVLKLIGIIGGLGKFVKGFYIGLSGLFHFLLAHFLHAYYNWHL